MNKLSDLIAALNIFLKYGDEAYPTNCQHDTLRVYPASMEISEEDMKKLDELGFIPDSEFEGAFVSYRFGSN